MVDLFPFQEEGRDFLASRNRALLADDMGLGKSAQAVAAARVVGAKNILVGCPATLRHNWVREFQKFGIQGPFDILGSKNFSYKPGYVQIASYNFFAEHVSEYLAGNPDNDVIILDEAHALKTPTAKRTRALLGEKCRGGGVVRFGKRVWQLSGTPMPNYPNELWPMMSALYPEAISFNGMALGYEDFIARYCEYNPLDMKIKGGKNLLELKRKFQPYFLRRKKTEVLKDLPPRVFGDLVLTDRKAAVEINGLLDDASDLILDLEMERANATNMAELRHQIGLIKVNPVTDIVVEELTDNSEKLVIFAWHRDVLQGLKEKLARFNPVMVIGGMADTAKQGAVDAFQTDPKVRIFLGQYLAAGEGLTLTAASNVLLVEASWTPKDNLQAADRCHRIGQKNSVLVRFVSIANSFDEIVHQVLRRKTETIKQVFA